MKRLLLICLAVAFSLGFVSCSDWTDIENKKFEQGRGHDDQYYANLRKWKAETDYDMGWGWFGGWGGSSIIMKNSLAGLPDSLYMVAIWGSWRPSAVSEAKAADLKFVQKVKGTKVLATVITGWVGVDVVTSGSYINNPQKEELFGWLEEWNDASTWRAADGTETRAAQEEAIRAYARALADSIALAGYEGLDIDYEPMAGGAGCKRELSNKDNFHIFVDELGKYMGPESGTGKLLVIDGEINQLAGRTMHYFDYFIWQSYGYSSESSLNSYLRGVTNTAKAAGIEPADFIKKFYTTVNFESYFSTGGGSFSGHNSRLEGQAAWQPTYEGETYRKGGWGSYHIEYEYTIAGKSGFYPWTRAALRMVHPPKTADSNGSND